MNENNEVKNKLKAKKIRRILLLNIDRELKSESNRKINIMINSKKIQDINKAYNSYKILLSETTTTYSNYVEMVEKSYPNNNIKTKKNRENQNRKKNEEQIIKSLNSSFESNSPAIDFVPNKVDLGKKKLSSYLRDKIKGVNSPNFFADNKLEETKIKDEVINKSTKLNKKGIAKVVDKIVKIKLNTDVEEDDINITNNKLKLRKYCFRLIKRKKKPKKSPKPKSLSPQKQLRDKTSKRNRFKKRKTIIGTHPLIVSLFGLKETNQELTRKETYKKVTKFLNPNIIDKINDSDKNKIKSVKTSKISSLKEMKPIKDKEKYYSDKKRKIRRIHSLNMGNIDIELFTINENKKVNIKNSYNSLIQFKFLMKEPIISTKLTRPQEFVINNNNTNKNRIYKKNSLLDNKSIKLKKDKNNVKFNDQINEDRQKKNKVRKSFARNSKNTVKIFSNGLNKLKLLSDQM